MRRIEGWASCAEEWPGGPVQGLVLRGVRHDPLDCRKLAHPDRGKSGNAWFFCWGVRCPRVESGGGVAYRRELPRGHEIDGVSGNGEGLERRARLARGEGNDLVENAWLETEGLGCRGQVVCRRLRMAGEGQRPGARGERRGIMSGGWGVVLTKLLLQTNFRAIGERRWREIGRSFPATARCSQPSGRVSPRGWYLFLFGSAPL